MPTLFRRDMERRKGVYVPEGCDQQGRVPPGGFLHISRIREVPPVTDRMPLEAASAVSGIGADDTAPMARAVFRWALAVIAAVACVAAIAWGARLA